MEKRPAAARQEPDETLDDGQLRKKTSGRVALCIDDNPGNLAMLEATLKQMTRMEVLLADNARQGLDMAIEHVPDLIFMDIHMPDMDGYEALKMIKANEALRDIPIIALTASAMELEIERGLVAGFFRYLTKPMDVHRLASTVNEVLGKQDQVSG